MARQVLGTGQPGAVLCGRHQVLRDKLQHRIQWQSGDRPRTGGFQDCCPRRDQESFAIKAFQNGKELDDITNVNETADVGDSAQNIKEVKDGASVNGSYVFKLADDSEVEVRVCTPTADEDMLAKKVFTN